WKHATEDGLATAEPAEAVRGADIIAILTPDMVQNEVYRDVIEPNAKPGAALLFAHGFSIIYDRITPRDDMDVILVAPKGPGDLVRRATAPWATPRASAERPAACLRRRFAKRPRPICSANRPSCAAAPRNWSSRASTPWSRPAISPRSPISNACTS